MKLYNLDNADRYAQYNNYGVKVVNEGNNCEMRSVEIHNKFGFDIQMGMVFKKCLVTPNPNNIFSSWGFAQCYTYHLWNKVGNTIYDSEFQWNHHQGFIGGIYRPLPFGLNKVGVVELPKWSTENFSHQNAQQMLGIVKNTLQKAALKGLDMVYFTNFAIDGTTGEGFDNSHLKCAIQKRTEQMEKYLQENLVY